MYTYNNLALLTCSDLALLIWFYSWVPCVRTTRDTTGWRRLIGCLFIGHFLQKSPVMSGSFKAYYGSSLPCSVRCTHDTPYIIQNNFHRKWSNPEIHRIQKLKFLGTNWNQINISIWFCTARYQDIWVSRFGFWGCSFFTRYGGFWGCGILSGNCHTYRSPSR